MTEKEWFSLPLAIRGRFSKRLAGGQTIVYAGEVLESWMSRAGWWLAQAARLIGGPLPLTSDAHVRNARAPTVHAASVVTVTEDTATSGQIWTRLYARRKGFPQVIHSSKRFAGPTGLEEYVGRGVGMTLTVYAREGALVFRSKNYFLELFGRRLFLPAWLTPGTLYVTHAELPDGKFSFTLQIFHPRSGLLLRQMAMFREISPMTSPLLWTLIGVQLALGLFDIVYHHEMLERLAWRVSQRRELNLHGARNLVYAVLFLALGLFELKGFWAMLVISVLVAEVVITLTDFVEEDLSRKLPASERVTHTLLAINYGAILSLLVPVLVGWASQPTAIVPVWRGVGSVLAPLAAAGVIVFGLRDFFAARRAQRLVLGNAAELVRALPSRQCVLITGATGFIGHRLTEALTSAGHDVIVLARDPAKAATLRPPFRLVTHLDQIANDSVIDTVINFAGEPVANGLWTRTKRRRILGSRLRMTRDVVRLIARLERHPAVMISGSSIGWYGTWDDEPLTEFDGGKRGFGHRVCEAWECAAKEAEKFGVRVVRLRIGIVLGTEAGMLSNLLAPFEFGLGGPIGSGEQWISWIERDDLIRLIAHTVATPQLSGAVNGTAPEPVRNATFAEALGRALHRPALLRMPASMLHRLAGDLADELLLRGQRVLPDKAQASGFQFRHETLPSALSAILGGTSAKACAADFRCTLETQPAR